MQSISEKRKEILKEREADKQKQLTIAERLTRRAKQLATKITLSDDIGEFEIEMRQPTRKQLDELLKLKQEIQQIETQEEANKKLYSLLADLCLDDSLDFEYWEKGDYALADLLDILNKPFDDVLTRYNEVKSFRKK